MFWQNKNPADQFSKARTWSVLLVLCITSTLSIGCSGGNPNGVETIPVTGLITWKGEPLANANVVFRPAEGRSSAGRTDEEGKYELLYDSSLKGAIPGLHKVQITAARELPGGIDSEGQPLTEQFIPAGYNAQSKLTAEVSESNHTFDFSLTTSK